MSHSTQKQPAETPPVLALDVIIKYSLVLTWLVYAAGLARLSGYLQKLGVPTESSFMPYRKYPVMV